jgi:membrane protease YdiL (CAAX protease family)
MSPQTSKNLIKRKPLLMYFVFAFAFFWLFLALELVFILVVLGMDMSAVPSWVFIGSSILGSWMPSLAAAVVTGVCEGRAAVGKLFGMFFKFKLPGRWYLAALLPVVWTFAAVGIYRLFDGEPAGGFNTYPVFWINLFLSTVLTGATGEEPGWRGFALPRLLQKRSPLATGLSLGVIWGFWHLPLWLMGGMPMSELLPYVGAFMVSIISLTVVMTWIFMRTSHSLVPMVLAHFTMNFALNLAVDGLGLAPQIPVFYIIAGLSAVIAAVVAAFGGLAPKKAVESAPAAA